MHKKQVVGISWYPVCWGMFCLLLSIPQLLSAQEARKRIIFDPIQIRRMEGFQLPKFEPFPEKTVEFPLHPVRQQSFRLPDFSLKNSYALPYYTNPAPLFRGDFSTNGVLKQFPNGALFGSGSQTSMAGLGRFNEASLGYLHTFNSKLSMQLSVDAVKMNMSHITRQAFSTSGSLTYQLSDQVGFKVFGTYDIGNSYGMSTHSYGATMSFDMSKRFGVEAGVERYYDPMRGRWETVPIVIPYYRFDKFTLGLDVGGILYEVLRNVVFDKRGDRGGPTIAPPRPSLPIR